VVVSTLLGAVLLRARAQAGAPVGAPAVAEAD
jgi:hypothetical protein